MKVLVVPFNYKNAYFPSAGVFIEEQIKAAEQFGCESHVLNVVAVPIPQILKTGFSSLGFKQHRVQGVTVTQFLFPALPKLPKLTHRIRLWGQKRLAQKLLRTWQPDVTHVHMFPGGDVARWLKSTYRIPYVVTEHLSGFAEGRYNPFQIYQAKACFDNASARIAVSQHLSQALNALSVKPFTIIPNCIDTAFFSAKADKPKSKGRRWITVGRLVEIKNHLGLIEAFAKANLPKDITLTIVGEGVMRPKLESLIKSLNLEARITLVGQLDKAQIKQMLEEHDGFVLSSHYETFGVVLIEAMSMGLPVLSTPCLGASEIITQPSLGMISDTGTKALSDAMQRFANEAYDSDVIRQHVIEHFSSKKIGETLAMLYRDVTETKGR